MPEVSYSETPDLYPHHVANHLLGAFHHERRFIIVNTEELLSHNGAGGVFSNRLCRQV